MSCLSPIIVNRNKAGRYFQDVVPCGRCPGCIAARQNDYVLRFYLAGKSAKFIWFVTLTFRDDALPVLCKPLPVEEWTDYSSDFIQVILREENSLFEVQDGFIVDNGSSLHEEYLSFLDRNRSKYEYCSPFFTYSSFSSKYLIPCSLCGTLDNSTVQRHMKRFRQFYKGKLRFKYVCAGEYGEQGHRPHYHLIIMDLEPSQIYQFKLLWQDYFGRCTYDQVSRLSDGDHLEFVSRYVAKYLVKGSFQEPNVKAGYSRSPRLMSSSNLVDYSEDFVSWYSGQDLFPYQDLPISSYAPEDLDRLIARLHLVVNGHVLGLGKSIKNKLFHGKFRRAVLSPGLSDGVSKSDQSYQIQDKASSLSKALSLRLQERAIESSLAELGCSERAQLEEVDPSTVEEFSTRLALDKLSRAQELLKKQKEYYQHSKF
jgi:hypothetical protein